MNPLRLAALSLLAVAMSCRDSLAPQRQTSDLEAARQRWSAQNLHTYAFTLQRSCFCGNVHPLYVAVVNDTVVGAFDLETGTWVDRQLGETIEDLFTFVQSAIDDEISYRVSDVHPIAPQTPLQLQRRVEEPA
jgi:hypothetical protein